MGRTGPLRWVFQALFWAVLVAQRALSDDVCRTGCRGASQNFKYTVGTTYKYNYDGKIDISLSSAEGQSTSTEVKAAVLLTQLVDCNQILKLQDVQIIGANGKKLGSIPDVEKPIRLNFHDGHIEDSICVERSDTQNSLNIKRAVASLFQAKLQTNHETDVFGLCPSEVASSKEGNVLVVSKKRNLNRCAYRENLKQDFMATTFNLNSEIKSSPILNSDYESTIRVKNGILDSATATENYLYVPFSVGKNGAKAQVTSKLQLVGTSKTAPKITASKPASIIFDNPHPVIAPTSNVNSILTAVKEVVKTIDVVVGEQTAKQFVTLIKTVRSSKKDDLLAVYNQVKSGVGFGDKVAAKKAFLDALLESATGDSIEVAVTLLKNNELSEIEKKLVYLGLSLVRHATESSLNAAAGLLNQKDLPYEAYLGIGNLAGRFCQQHSCKNVEAVNKLTLKLVQKLGDGKAADRKEENDIIFVLKALSNFRYLSDSILQKITAIAQDKKAPNRLRAAALETYLADPCKDKLRDSALGILQDIQQDSEVRIKAYLALAQCPNAKIGNAVKALLEKEPSYQVGGFITSHIRNIKSSANPDKETAKQYLGFSISKKFPVDFRKWSYNGEFSYAVDTLGLAASSEANIIYSQDSFLPRTTSLNLTAEVFGHTLNFLELQTRQENLDKLIEHYFGPKGVLRTSSLGELLKNNEKTASSAWDHLRNKLTGVLRSRRDVTRAEIENIGKAVQIKENELNKELDLDLSVKAFGSEILFANLNVYQNGLTPESVVDKIIESFAQGLDRLKQFDETLRSNLLFLDVEFAYPTGLGFPLRIAVEGTSNVQVKAKGGLDVRALNAGKDTDVKIQLIPSANIEVAGRLTLDSLLVENGLKVVSTLHSSTGGGLTVSLFNGRKGIDVKFGLPIQKQKLISATHEIVFHAREQAGKETNEPLKFAQGKDFSVCLDQLSPFIGLTFCGEINGPNLAGSKIPVLPFPFAGDANFEITIENDDVSEFHIKNEVSQGHTTAQFLVETIGKNKQKKVSFDLQASITPEKFVKAVFSSPGKTALAEGRITTTADEKSISVRLSQDQTELLAKIGLAVKTSGPKSTYTPILEWKAPGNQQKLPISVQGQIVVEQSGPNTEYNFENVRLALPEKTVSVTGKMGIKGKELYSDIVVSDGSQFGSLKGIFVADPSHLRLNAEVKNSINPNANFHVKAELERFEMTRYGATLTVIHGADLSSKVNMISLASGFERRFKNPKDFLLQTKNKVTYPLIGLDSKFEYKQTPKSLDYELDVQYNDIKFGSDLEVEINKKEQGDFKIEMEIYGLDNNAEFKAERQIQGEESKISNSVEINGKKLEVNGKIKHHIKPSNVDVGADLTVVLPTHPTPFQVNSGLKYNPNELDAHHKVTSGSTVVIDAFLKANKAGNANGNVKVNIKNLLVVNGNVKANKGVGNGEILIDAQSLKKQVKAETKFQIQPPSVYNVELVVYPVFGQDKSQKIVLTTDNKISPTSVDTKNTVDLLGKVLQFNANGQRTGEKDNGKVSGEVELTLPNNQYILGKMTCDHNIVKEVLNGHSIASLEYRSNKNSPGRKVGLKAIYKDTNPKVGIFDVEYNLSADDSNGKNVNADISYKSTKQGERRNASFKNKIYGSILKNPLEIQVNVNGKPLQGEYEAITSYGPTASLKVLGKYDVQGQKTPYSGSLEVDMTSPSKALKTLKASLSGTVSRPEKRNEYSKLEGAAKLFIDDDGSTPDAILDFEGQGSIKCSVNDGEIKGSLKCGKLEPLSAAAGYSRLETAEEQKLNGNFAVQYGKGKSVKADASLVKGKDHRYKLEAELDTPSAEYKNTKLSVDTKRSEDGRHVTSRVQVNCDGKIWNLNSEISASDISPLIDLQSKSPDGKKCQIFVKANKVSDRELSAEYKIISEVKDFLLEGDVNANLESIEEFFIKSNVNSPNLKLNKVYWEAVNKPGKTGRRIQVVVKSAGKPVVQGSTSYASREEQGKYIVEGSGSFKIKEESKSANFKYIYQRLFQEKNGEQGIDISFDGGLGNRAIDAEFKATNKQFRILNSYCEEKKECAHVEVDSKINVNDASTYNNELQINVDLRKLGVPHEFGLKAVTKRQGYLVDHTVDVHFQNQGNSKYQYSFYVHPKKIGASLTTPKRLVSLEGNLDVPKNFKEGGKINGELVFYLDKKNHPNKKSSTSGWLTIDVQQYELNGEVKLTHPGLQRPLSASIKTDSHIEDKGEVTIVSELDVFAQPNQKLTVTYKLVGTAPKGTEAQITAARSVAVQSAGLGVDIFASESMTMDRQTYSGEYATKVVYKVGSSNYDNAVSVKASRTQFDLLLRVLSVDLLRTVNKMNLNKEEQSVESEFSSYSNDPLVTHLEIKNFNTVKYSAHLKSNPREKLQFNSGLIPGQVADIRADHVTGSGRLNLFHATLKLDDANFFKPDYSINSKEIEKVIGIVREKFSAYMNGLQDLGKGWTNDIRKEINQLGELGKRAAPNLQPLKDYYRSEIEKIKKEILADKSIKELGEVLHRIFGTLLHTAGEIFGRISELVEEVAHTIRVTFAKIIESIEKELVPSLKEVAEKLTAVATNLANGLVEITAGYLTAVSKMIEKYQPEIKQLAATFGEMGQDVARFLQKAYEHTRKIVIEQWTNIYQEIKALPVFEQLREQYKDILNNGFPFSEAIINGIKEFSSTVREVIPSEFLIRKELVDIIDLTIKYLEAKVKRTPIDDIAVFNKLIELNALIFRKIIGAISSPSFNVQHGDIPISLDFLKKLPKLVAVKFSPIAHLLQDDASEQVIAFVLSLFNNPRQWVAPFPLNAMLVHGQHVFTFDGKHLTFPANCKYLLARDAVDGNFTLVGTYANGLLSAITLADKRDSITIKKGGQVLVNNANSDLPARKPDLSAYRGYYTIILKSTAGIKVDCLPDLAGCGVQVSGFYHGRVKGLLGNGNNEPYDDFTAANGKIVASEEEFGNSYKVGNCPKVSVPSHQHQDNAACNKLFGWESSLRYCYPFVSTDNFKMACAHGLAAGVKDTELMMAKAYTAACHQHNIPVFIPSELAKCTNSEKPFNIGDTFSVKVPSKSADIVLLVDTVKSNEAYYHELVQPLVQEIGKSLHSKGINDVAFHLIAYGGENQWPSHVTVNGNLNFKGKAPALKFTEAPKEELLSDAGVLSRAKPYLESIEGLLKDLKLAFGLDLAARTYTEALDYPFRAQAAKAIVVATSKPCELGRLKVLQKLRTLLFDNNQITLNLITPFEGMTVKDAKKTKDVVGFNKENVFTISQGKKKPEGSSELHKDLHYDDFCVDFTVKNRGNVFVADNFRQAKPDARKQFVHIAAHNIVDQLTNVEEGLDCECKLVSHYGGLNVCKEAYSKERIHKRGANRG